MQQFIPFEDDWDALEQLRPEDLIPYCVGMLDSVEQGDHCTSSTRAFTPRLSPTLTPMALAVPAGSSST